ncbi:hypothetical protein FRC10_010175 [Ceratobasidium sp. 414]|nr:hypothetical protein FRC10_010175 [Ceratobasidium sp. 414]
MHLTEHGCEDLTRHLDPPSSNNQPTAHGGFGFVYNEKLRDGRRVAIKALRVPLNADDEVGKFPKRAARELCTWSKCSHPNVLPLLGLAKFQNQIRMVSLWMENGSLPSYLDAHPDISRCSMGVHVCNGLEYLHRARVVSISLVFEILDLILQQTHGDLKGNNVLVSSEGVPMITDFGNAVLQQGTLQFTETVKQNGFTIRWTAPEILEDKEKQSKEADMFALGMTILVLLEIITGKVPYFYTTNRKTHSSLVGLHANQNVPSGLLNAIVAAIITAILVKKEAPKRPEKHIPLNSQHGDALWSLLQGCWEYEPEKRPSAAQVAEIVRLRSSTPAPNTNVYESQMKGITREGLMPVQAEPEEPAEAEIASAVE